MEESVTQITDAQLQTTNETVTDETRPDPLDGHSSIMESSQSAAGNGETVTHDNNLSVTFSNNNTDCIKVELLSHNTKNVSCKDEITSAVENDVEDSVCADKEKSCGSKMELSELECCEYCGGPVKKRRLCSPLKRFCSKACAKSAKKLKQRKDDDSSQDSEDGGTGIEMEGHVNLNDYIQLASAKAAPESSFKHQVTVDVPGLKPGMKLEAVDRNNPPSYCVATVVKVVGHRVCIRYDGYGNDDSNDFWCNFQAEELHPIGWCAQNGYPLQAPKGINSSLDDWRTFLTQTLTGALAAPQDLFRKSQDHFQPRVHGFEVGMKLEVIHPQRPHTICAATVTKSLGPYYFAVTTDFIHDIPTVTFCCHGDSPGIFAPGWSIRNGADFTIPASCNKKTFSWDKYLALCRAQSAPSQLFKKVKLSRFKTGMKVETVDLEHPFTVRVATVIDVMGRLVQLFFDGQSRFQFLDVESPNIYPIGWCQRTGHPLETPFGAIVPDNKVIIPEGNDKIAMPSFLEVMGKHHAAQSSRTQAAAVTPRKSLARHENDKEKEAEKDLKEGELKDKDDGSNETDSSDEDDATGSERFYHNKNQIFFNKGCCIGPLLDLEKVSQLPDATSPGKVSTVIRTGLEMVAKAARDPEKVIDLMQEGCGVRVVVKHKGKILKKAISRVDSRPKLERYLKRFCRRLICCEFFLSLKPVGRPCPDQCKTDDQGNLLGPKGLKAKRSREYFEVKHLGFEKKKRGRKRKSDLLTMPPDPIVIKRQLMDSTTNGVQQHAAIVSGALTTCTAGATVTVKTTLATPQPNGVVVQKVRAPVAVITPGVVRSVPASPGLLKGPVRMASALSMARTADIAAAPVISQVPRAMAAAPVQMSGGLAAGKQGIQIQKPHSAGISANKFNFSGIVTNVSNQRFSTNAGSAGATITFGRAPPNVTIVSTNNSPLITKNAPDLSSPVSPNRTVAKQNGQIAGQSQVVGVVDRGGLHYSFGGATSVAHVGPPPPYSQARVQRQIRATISSQPNGSATTVVYSGSEQTPPNLPGGTASAGHIRPTGMRSHVVKHTPSGTPPPPPLVPTTLFQPSNTNIRPPGPTTTTPVPSPTCPSTGTAHMHQPRCTISNTVAVGAVATRSQQAAQNVPPLIGPPPPLTSTTTVLPDTTSNPYGAGEVRVVQSPRLTVSVNTRGLPTVTMQQGNPLSSINGPRMMRHTPLGPHGDQPGHCAPQGNPQGLKPRSVIQPSQHSNIRQPTVGAQTAHAPLSPATKSYNQSHLSNVRGGTALQPGHRPPSQTHASGPSLIGGGQGSGKPRESGSQTSKNEKGQDMREQCEDPEAADEEKSSSQRKKNMWWLKKKRRRRSRLTYIKAKYKKKEDEGTSNVASAVDELMTVPTCGSTSIPVVSVSSQGTLVSSKSEPGAKIADQQPLYMVIERPKRGRPPKGLLSPKLKEETDLPDAIDFNHDPDWKVGVEEERRRGKIVKRKKRLKRGFGSPTTFSSAPVYTGVPLVKEIGSRLVATLPTNPPPLTVKSPPVSPRHNVVGEKRLSPKTGSYKGHHPFLSRGPVRRSPSPFYESSITTSPPLKARMHRPIMAEAGTNTSLPGILNGKSLDLPANPATWTVDQVVQYVRATDCANYSNIFLEQEIDGQALMLLSRDSLMQFTRMKLGPTLKMCSYIAQLKARAR